MVKVEEEKPDYIIPTIYDPEEKEKRERSSYSFYFMIALIFMVTVLGLYKMNGRPVSVETVS